MNNVNGNNAAGQQTVSVNPQEIARTTLMFLARAEFRKHERQMFDYCESMLTAIAEGRVLLSQPEPPADATRADCPQPQPAAPDTPALQ